MLTKRKNEAPLNAADSRFAIVCARFNERYTDAMLGCALDTLAKAGASLVGTDRRAVRFGAPSGRALPRGAVVVARVPGSFEIPVVAAKLARSGKFDAILALGCIIEGETDHARIVGESTAHALQRISVETGVPCIFGVVTARTVAQAKKRCLGKTHNRSSEAARAAVEMAAWARKNRKK